jgi:FLVCR family feline leukemia virus subgroup C receptor-related protein
MIQKFSFERNIKASAALNALGAGIKYAASTRKLYGLLLAGQVVSAISQAMFLALPAELAAIWFSPKQRSIATGLMVLANQMGIALGLLLSPRFTNSEFEFEKYILGIFLICLAITVLIVLIFPKKPKAVPSASMLARSSVYESISFRRDSNPHDYLEDSAALNATKQQGFVQQTLNLVRKNTGFTLMCLIYSLNVSAFYVWATLLEAMILPYHSDHIQIGLCGFIGTVTSLFGALLFPVIASYSGHFQAVNIILSFLTAGSSVGFWVTITSTKSTWLLIDIVSGLLNFMYGGMLSFGMEFGAELAYPVEENLSVGIYVFLSQVFGIILIESLSLSNSSSTEIILTICSISSIALILSIFVPNQLNRIQFENNRIRSSTFTDTSNNIVISDSQ